MKITERQLRRVIKNTMNEMHEEMFQMQDSHSSERLGHSMMDMSGLHSSERLGHPMMQKASSCMKMDAHKLFMMCTMICAQNPEMAMHCKRLCKCIYDGDMDGCCDCLSQICSCSHCSDICSICCKC